MKAVWDNDIDDEESAENDFDWGGYEATIFLIEATKPMFDPDVDGHSYFAKCIECCKAFQLQQIRSSKRGPTAIVLFGTKQGTDSWSNVSVLLDFSPPSADRVKSLMRLLESDDFEDFDTKYGHSTNFSIANALWFCHQLLVGYKKKLSRKHIIMMTCTPDPHCNDTDKQRQAKHRASSLNDASILLNVVPLGGHFDKKAFYSELVQIVNGQDDDEDFMGIEEPSESVEEIIIRINKCGSQKRSTGRVFFHLGGEVKISVAIYNLVQQQVVPTRRPLFRQTNDEVQAKPQHFSADTGQVLQTFKEMKTVDYGEREISFESDEWIRAKQIANNGLVLLGFKPKTCIELFLQKAAFIYPEEKLISGSRITFAALHDRCVARNVVPICLFTPRKVSPPKMVALWPQEEKKDAEGIQIAAQGFVVFYLPYANNIRDLPPVSTTLPDPELVDLTRVMVRKLTAEYNPYAIKNPKLQSHWANIEAIALGLEEPEKFTEETLPDNSKIRSLLGDLTKDFIGMALGSDYSIDDAADALSAKRAKPPAERPAKKPKLVFSPENMANIVESRQVDRLTVDQMKQYLQGENVSFHRTIKKAEIVNLIYDHFQVDP